ncbi:hypothetical protein [Thioclava sp. GXIMD4215]|uniref:hypothetical protein n=1 Tax=Thioclava sp. GXIMD4215 TaxID=3131928 RepID=UPI003245DA09
MFLRYGTLMLMAGLALGGPSRAEPRAQQIATCLEALSAYGAWLEQIEAMRLPGVISGFYGSPARELARVDNGRYLLLAELAQDHSDTEMRPYFDHVANPWKARLAEAETADFATLGQGLGEEVTACTKAVFAPSLAGYREALNRQ